MDDTVKIGRGRLMRNGMSVPLTFRGGKGTVSFIRTESKTDLYLTTYQGHPWKDGFVVTNYRFLLPASDRETYAVPKEVVDAIWAEANRVVKDPEEVMRLKRSLEIGAQSRARAKVKGIVKELKKSLDGLLALGAEIPKGLDQELSSIVKEAVIARERQNSHQDAKKKKHGGGDKC